MVIEENVKVVFCYDEDKNTIHYSRTSKGNTYYCIDCGSELVCKDGNKNIKHLSHKNTINCGGTGESVFHKHWKENLFKTGMYINIANKVSYPNNIEILDVLNEVSLNKRYKMDWDIEIIVDTLLITEYGDIVIEINYTNKKDWVKLKPYYDELSLLKVFEVSVGKCVNDPLNWFCLGEDEEINVSLKLQKVFSKEEKLLKRESKRLTSRELKLNEIKSKLNSNEYKERIVYFNFKNKMQRVEEGVYELSCLERIGENTYNKLNLKFDMKKLKCTIEDLKKFEVRSGIKHCLLITDSNISSGDYHEVISFKDIKKADYDNKLYANLCNV
ncbi:hypothetical protein [Psychrobacillus phage Perkons]|nr:hypothetical protein [Psychrobacillus phage Perkons]